MDILPTVASSVLPASSSEPAGGITPISGGAGGDSSHDPGHGRRSPDAVHLSSDHGHRDPGPVVRSRGPFGTTWASMADRLITASDADAGAGPAAESDMVTGTHRRAARQAILAAALAETLGDRVVEGYTVERPPGRAPEVIQPDPPVRIGTIIDVVA